MTLEKPMDPKVVRAISKTVGRNPMENAIKEKEGKSPESLFIKGRTNKKK